MDQLLRKISCFILTVIRSVSLNWSLGLRILFILVRPVWTKPHSCSEAHQNGALPQRLFSPSCVICFFLSQLPCSMPSMLVGAPFESSSMLCTYPRTTKPSKQRRKGTQKPITHSSLLWTSSPLWTSSSEPPLRCGHHCRRCGFLHSPVRLK